MQISLLPCIAMFPLQPITPCSVGLKTCLTDTKDAGLTGGSSGVLQIGEERSDVETSVLIFMVNSTFFLLRSGINNLFSSRVNSMSKRSASKNGSKDLPPGFLFYIIKFL